VKGGVAALDWRDATNNGRQGNSFHDLEERIPEWDPRNMSHAHARYPETEKRKNQLSEARKLLSARLHNLSSNKLAKLIHELYIHDRDAFVVPPITIPNSLQWRDVVERERAKEAGKKKSG
jgi:hypothetical protein